VSAREAQVDPGPRPEGHPHARRARVLDRLAVLALTLLAAGLFLYKLGTRSVWLDEGDTFTTASQHGAALWHWMLNDGGNMVSYYLGMHVMVTLFGTSPAVMRLPTALAAIATVPVSFYLLRRLFDRRAAVFGAAFVAVSLPFVYWAQQARGYAVATLLVTASTLALVLGVQTRRRAANVAYVALSVLAIYTILLSALVLVAQAASLTLRRRNEVPWRALAFSGAAIGVLCVPVGVAAAIRGTAPVDWIGQPGSVFGGTMRDLVVFLASARANGTPGSPLPFSCFWRWSPRGCSAASFFSTRLPVVAWRAVRRGPTACCSPGSSFRSCSNTSSPSSFIPCSWIDTC